MNDGGSQQGLSRRSMTIAAFSTVVEWYDFTLYLYLATILSRVFYGGGTTSLAVTLGGFAVSYLMRPLGALVFGQVGDRFGRRRMMLLSMALMTIAMLGIALLPTRAAIGPAAGWLLLALRCVMAFSVGGEYTGVVAYLYEGARPDRRGLVTSSASAASEVGGLLAVGISARSSPCCPPPSWRPGAGASRSSLAPHWPRPSALRGRPCRNPRSSNGSGGPVRSRPTRSPMP